MALRMTAQEARALGFNKPKKTKYHNEKVVLDGITFDSKKEARYYANLLIQKKAGIVKEFELQPVFILQDGYRTKDGKKVREIIYKADFRVTYTDRRQVVIDVKGHKTKEYLLKKKMLLFRYPDIEFEEA